ncbi:MAG: hypothetical protein U1E22_03475 [Coriobacteriia bacterium]|nr:hypothetical protein [Coriobacteriia bacterium]
MHTELFNKRGVHGFTHGAAERELADSYNAQADAADAAQFHRVAEVMRSLAEGYAAEAERAANRDPDDD